MNQVSLSISILYFQLLDSHSNQKKVKAHAVYDSPFLQNISLFKSITKGLDWFHPHAGED
jgi:hypothetical protein